MTVKHLLKKKYGNKTTVKQGAVQLTKGIAEIECGQVYAIAAGHIPDVIGTGRGAGCRAGGQL